ncbi:Diaminopimelate epimerase-like protein [Pluteus cervinus]|uniref:Diaminopimelate epimerase-like protein n=1 Tax=Pluteus cervinus TaxID=181527 RepID=A0ACD3A3T2_9AGAR|nr:Diaminopimelate epimerase-like protein [Pluteus cervinus]
MTFMLLQLTSEEALEKLQPLPERLRVPGLGEWGGFVGVYSFFVSKEDDEGNTTTLRARMFDGSLEDPATGSAASTLAGWLAQQKGEGIWTFKIIQGVEMGRSSEITVVVEVDVAIAHIYLEGGAVQVMQGQIAI